MATNAATPTSYSSSFSTTPLDIASGRNGDQCQGRHPSTADNVRLSTGRSSDDADSAGLDADAAAAERELDELRTFLARLSPSAAPSRTSGAPLQSATSMTLEEWRGGMEGAAAAPAETQLSQPVHASVRVQREDEPDEVLAEPEEDKLREEDGDHSDAMSAAWPDTPFEVSPRPSVEATAADRALRSSPSILVHQTLPENALVEQKTVDGKLHPPAQPCPSTPASASSVALAPSQLPVSSSSADRHGRSSSTLLSENQWLEMEELRKQVELLQGQMQDRKERRRWTEEVEWEGRKGARGQWEAAREREWEARREWEGEGRTWEFGLEQNREWERRQGRLMRRDWDNDRERERRWEADMSPEDRWRAGPPPPRQDSKDSFVSLPFSGGFGREIELKLERERDHERQLQIRGHYPESPRPSVTSSRSSLQEPARYRSSPLAYRSDDGRFPHAYPQKSEVHADALWTTASDRSPTATTTDLSSLLSRSLSSASTLPIEPGVPLLLPSASLRAQAGERFQGDAAQHVGHGPDPHSRRPNGPAVTVQPSFRCSPPAEYVRSGLPPRGPPPREPLPPPPPGQLSQQPLGSNAFAGHPGCEWFPPEEEGGSERSRSSLENLHVMQALSSSPSKRWSITKRPLEHTPPFSHHALENAQVLALAEKVAHLEKMLMAATSSVPPGTAAVADLTSSQPMHSPWLPPSSSPSLAAGAPAPPQLRQAHAHARAARAQQAASHQFSVQRPSASPPLYPHRSSSSDPSDTASAFRFNTTTANLSPSNELTSSVSAEKRGHAKFKALALGGRSGNNKANKLGGNTESFQTSSGGTASDVASLSSGYSGVGDHGHGQHVSGGKEKHSAFSILLHPHEKAKTKVPSAAALALEAEEAARRASAASPASGKAKVKMGPGRGRVVVKNK